MDKIRDLRLNVDALSGVARRMVRRIRAGAGIQRPSSVAVTRPSPGADDDLQDDEEICMGVQARYAIK